MSPALNEAIDTGYQSPRDPAEIWLARVWQHVLGFPVGIRENFFGVGGNSLDAARVIDAIRAEFGVQLPLNAVTEDPTVDRLAGLLRVHEEQLSGPLVPIEDGDGLHPPLFLVHPDDGQAARYCALAHELGEDFALFGLQARGLYSDEQPRHTVAQMADAYVAAIREVWPTGPYLLGGCGIGAAIAYEMAVRLDDVRLVAAIDGELLGLLEMTPDTSAERPLRVRLANQNALRDWQPSPYSGPIDVFGKPTIKTALTAVVQRMHDCGTQEDLAGVLRELIG